MTPDDLAKELSFKIARYLGHGRLAGAGMVAPKFNPNRILLNELTITGAFCYDVDGFDRALELLASGRLPLDELLEPDDVPLAGALEAMHGLHDGRIAAKVLIAPGAAR